MLVPIGRFDFRPLAEGFWAYARVEHQVVRTTCSEDARPCFFFLLRDAAHWGGQFTVVGERRYVYGIMGVSGWKETVFGDCMG